MNQFLNSLSERNIGVQADLHGAIQPRSTSRFEAADGSAGFDLESNEVLTETRGPSPEVMADRHAFHRVSTVSDVLQTVTEPRHQHTPAPQREEDQRQVSPTIPTAMPDRLGSILQPAPQQQIPESRATSAPQPTLIQQVQNAIIHPLERTPQERLEVRTERVIEHKRSLETIIRHEHGLETVFKSAANPERSVPAPRITEPSQQPQIAPRARSMIEPRSSTVPSRREPERQSETKNERTVQVTIGRLEVRVQAPASTATNVSKPRSESKVMSLDEYLARRDRGSS
jgi:hypothetical protein